MLTALEHEELGRKYGFPECCIEQWVSDHTNAHCIPSGIARGVKFVDFDFRRYYVPCSECMKTGTLTYDQWSEISRTVLYDHLAHR